ncbi:hypothetical protein BC828DRAFT_381422 [Blastocladiella britannica]|nr:hypothetical protein BC828DRAFT_381422 [Blastocladiella britannica]
MELMVKLRANFSVGLIAAKLSAHCLWSARAESKSYASLKSSSFVYANAGHTDRNLGNGDLLYLETPTAPFDTTPPQSGSSCPRTSTDGTLHTLSGASRPWPAVICGTVMSPPTTTTPSQLNVFCLMCE